MPPPRSVLSSLVALPEASSCQVTSSRYPWKHIGRTGCPRLSLELRDTQGLVEEPSLSCLVPTPAGSLRGRPGKGRRASAGQVLLGSVRVSALTAFCRSLLPGSWTLSPLLYLLWPSPRSRTCQTIFRSVTEDGWGGGLSSDLQRHCRLGARSWAVWELSCQGKMSG